MQSIKWVADRYKLIKPLGSGGSGLVFHAIDHKDPDEPSVAIKLLGSRPTESPALSEEFFRREVSSLSVLSHPTIVQLIGHGLDEATGLFYIVLEYIDRADTLEQRIQTWKPSPLDAVSFLLDLLAAVSHAHESHIIHRDLNPRNILLDWAGNAKIIDFGVSKILGMLTAGQTVNEFYTRPYASPEQIQTGDASYASDVYSLAAVFYFVLTGSHPDAALPLAQQFTSIDEHLQINDLFGGFDPVLRQVAVSMAAADPAQRYSSAGRALLDLQAALEQAQLQSQTFALYLTNNAVRNLYEQTITDSQDPSTARSMVENDLASGVHIAAGQSQANAEDYDIIGSNLSLRCTIESHPSRPHEQSHFIVKSIQGNRAPHRLELDRQHGYSAHARWRVLLPGQPLPASASTLTGLLDDLEAFFTTKLQERKRHERRADLVDTWRSILHLDYQLKEEAMHRLKYISFDPVDDEMVIEVRLSAPCLQSPFEEGDLISMTSMRGGRSITVGRFLSADNLTIRLARLRNTRIEQITQSGNLSLDESLWSAAWHRQRQALDSLVDNRSVNPRLPDVLMDPNQVARGVEEPISYFFNQQLDEQKRAAVSAALAAKDLYLIQGPPGTGKSELIVEVIAQLVSANPDARVLLVSQSNVAIDQVLVRMERITQQLPALRIARIGSPDKIAPEAASLTVEHSLQRWAEGVSQATSAYMASRTPLSYERKSISTLIAMLEELQPLLPRRAYSPNLQYDPNLISGIELIRAEMPQLQLEPTQKSFKMALEQLAESANAAKSPLENTLDEWLRRVSGVISFEEEYLQACNVVAGTCVGVAGNRNLPDQFDWAIIDEAGRATPSELLIPMIRARHSILVGDHKQLPPVIDEKTRVAANDRTDIDPIWLNQSLFEYLFNRLGLKHKTVLQTQYRMHPHIASLIGDVFYREENLLSAALTGERSHGWRAWPTSIVWLSTSQLNNRYEAATAVGSKSNLAEAKAIVSQLTNLERHQRERQQQKDVAVISGYKAQIELLTRLIDPTDKSQWRCLDIEINTVDAFQGRERNIVFYSVVRSNRKFELGFLKDYRRLNVALSRARELLIVVGDHIMVNQAVVFDGPNPFKDVITHMVAHPGECRIEELQDA